MSDDFWAYLDRLIAENRMVIDRPKGSRHPCFPEIVYLLDYGYFDVTTAGDGGGIDFYLGSRGTRDLSAVILTMDLHKRDAEIKLVLGCTEEETQIAFDHLNSGGMRALLVRRSKEET
jgi:inorganic pyrophosphatase